MRVLLWLLRPKQCGPAYALGLGAALDVFLCTGQWLYHTSVLHPSSTTCVRGRAASAGTPAPLPKMLRPSFLPPLPHPGP